MNVRIVLLSPLLMLAASAHAADDTGVTVLDPVEVTAAQRTMSAFRTLQAGLERNRSDREEDAETIVCEKRKPTGSNIPVINCATNRYWNRIRAASLQSGFGGNGAAVTGGGTGAVRQDDKMFTMTLNDFNALEKRFGKLPKKP